MRIDEDKMKIKGGEEMEVSIKKYLISSFIFIFSQLFPIISVNALINGPNTVVPDHEAEIQITGLFSAPDTLTSHYGLVLQFPKTWKVIKVSALKPGGGYVPVLRDPILQSKFMPEDLNNLIWAGSVSRQKLGGVPFDFYVKFTTGNISFDEHAHAIIKAIGVILINGLKPLPMVVVP